MKRKKRAKELVSAGGVVYRVNDGEVEVVVCGLNTPPIWGLPKGTPAPLETREQTALREVTEETGLEVEIEEFIDSVDYWFFISTGGERVHKTVFFYLMSPRGGDVSLHDHEFDQVRWMPVTEALQTLTYENEVAVVRKCLSVVSKKARLG